MKTLPITNSDLFRMSLAGAIAAVFLTLFIGGFHPAGYTFAVLIPILLTVRSGVELDFTTHKYRKFSSVMGRKKGEWKPYSTDHQLVLLKKCGSKRMSNLHIRIISSGEVEGDFYELYIMDPTHTKRLFLNSTKSRRKINRTIEQITRHSSLKLVTYNPQTAR